MENRKLNLKGILLVLLALFIYVISYGQITFNNTEALDQAGDFFSSPPGSNITTAFLIVFYIFGTILYLNYIRKQLPKFTKSADEDTLGDRGSDSGISIGGIVGDILLRGALIFSIPSIAFFALKLFTDY